MSQAATETGDLAFEGIVDRSVLSQFVETLQAVVSEATFQFGPDGIRVEAVSADTVGMVNQTLYRETFESYEAGEFETGINLERFEDYLGKGKSDLVKITFSNRDRKFRLEMGEVSLTIAAIDPDTVRNGATPPDGLELSTDVSMEGAALSHAVDVAGMVSDHIDIECDPDRERPLHIVGEGDTDDARVRFGDSLEEGSKIPEACESMFGRDHIDEMCSVIPSNESVRLRSGDELPLKLEYEYADGNAEVMMLLAPRLDTTK